MATFQNVGLPFKGFIYAPSLHSFLGAFLSYNLEVDDFIHPLTGFISWQCFKSTFHTLTILYFARLL